MCTVQLLVIANFAFNSIAFCPLFDPWLLGYSVHLAFQMNLAFTQSIQHLFHACKTSCREIQHVRFKSNSPRASTRTDGSTFEAIYATERWQQDMCTQRHTKQRTNTYVRHMSVDPRQQPVCSSSSITLGCPIYAV
ncbi:hypothetical protein BD410DRAFT_636892 [Rickenella mellea]|uniref:Uncharacterized protein n=1 Tax=Rickenella mellea TaxID=50990 RepID=A0A4Y7QD74_9AGAM|nr:hypothetical protein BD410DRAFT_636892 [Rickenella mellea]